MLEVNLDCMHHMDPSTKIVTVACNQKYLCIKENGDIGFISGSLGYFDTSFMNHNLFIQWNYIRVSEVLIVYTNSKFSCLWRTKYNLKIINYIFSNFKSCSNNGN